MPIKLKNYAIINTLIFGWIGVWVTIRTLLDTLETDYINWINPILWGVFFLLSLILKSILLKKGVIVYDKNYGSNEGRI